MMKRLSFLAFCLYILTIRFRAKKKTRVNLTPKDGMILDKYLNVMPLSCLEALKVYTSSFLVNCSNISRVMVAMPKLGRQPHSSRAALSSRLSGQLSAIACFSGSTL